METKRNTFNLTYDHVYVMSFVWTPFAFREVKSELLSAAATYSKPSRSTRSITILNAAMML